MEHLATFDPAGIQTPQTLEQVKDSFSLWFERESLRGAPKPVFHFLAEKETQALRLEWKPGRAQAQPPQIFVDENVLACRWGDNQIRLLLLNFRVKSALEPQCGLSLEFWERTQEDTQTVWTRNLAECVAQQRSEPHPFLENVYASVFRATCEKLISNAGVARNPAFLKRAFDAVLELDQELPSEDLETAATASTDYQVLLQALMRPQTISQLRKKDPLAAARLRGIERQAELIEAGEGVLGVDEAAKNLGISRQGVDKRRRNGTLIGLPQGKKYLYPSFQFTQGGTLPHLESILVALSDHDPWMQLTFFVNPNSRLAERSPLAALRAGEVDSVLVAAEQFGEQGAA